MQKRGSFFLSFLLLIVSGIFTVLEPERAHSEPLTIRSERIHHFFPGSPEQATFGRLEFLGGLELFSDHEDFGGLSGLRWLDERNSSFIAVTDTARVITGKLLREKLQPVAIKGARITRVRNRNGRVITGADDKDSESLEISGGRIFIGYERNDRIGRFRLKDGVLIADGTRAFQDFNAYGFANNKGPEALAVQPVTGLLYMFAEHSPDEQGNHHGFVLSDGKVIVETGLRIRDGFSVTDAAFLPSGDLLVLERYYSLFSGVSMRIRRIMASNLGDDGPLDGDLLIDASPAMEIDNMEGMAVSKMTDGSTRITIVSDDNYSEWQRTLLLEFRLAE